ncbi:hypothetical protein ACFPT7_02195 [Acidicapsa dinghuensis]|uniref:DNA transfer protein p32 n=1 Tax=Acidicapsa dinghuensis TaxID=2218256 RepID=A0ABW1EA05_9BACT|nr:hypothetical protein [Acidicapsa dinghuensis]
MSVTGGIMAGVGALGSLGSAAMESSAADKAAETQANAAQQAEQLQGDLGQESLGYENYQYQQDRANEQPFLQSGANNLATLNYLLGQGSPNAIPGGTGTGAGSASSGQTLSIPGINGSVSIPGVQGLTGTPNTNLGAFGSLLQQYPGGQFTAPTAAQAAQTPGYQFALNQGENAVQASAAANGSLLTGGTLNAEQQFGQGLANTNYNNVYNQALQSYNTNYNTWANNQANQFNRLAAMAGMGQTSAQKLGAAGMQSAGQVAQTLGNTGAAIGQDNMNAASATATGYLNSANTWGGAFNGIGNNVSQLGMLYAMMNGNANYNGAGGVGGSGQDELNYAG